MLRVTCYVLRVKCFKCSGHQIMRRRSLLVGYKIQQSICGINGLIDSPT